MNRLKYNAGIIWRAGLVVAAGGTALASSCSTSEVRSVLSGIQAVTVEIDEANNQDISFSDWLASELDD